MVSRREKDRARARGKRRKQGLDGFRRDDSPSNTSPARSSASQPWMRHNSASFARKLALFFAARGSLLGAESRKTANRGAGRLRGAI